MIVAFTLRTLQQKRLYKQHHSRYHGTKTKNILCTQSSLQNGAFIEFTPASTCTYTPADCIHCLESSCTTLVRTEHFHTNWTLRTASLLHTCGSNTATLAIFQLSLCMPALLHIRSSSPCATVLRLYDCALQQGNGYPLSSSQGVDE